MNRVSTGSLLAMIGVVLLPQLLFFWLAPQDAAARWAVYIVGTGAHVFC